MILRYFTYIQGGEKHKVSFFEMIVGHSWARKSCQISRTQLSQWSTEMEPDSVVPTATAKRKRGTKAQVREVHFTPLFLQDPPSHWDESKRRVFVTNTHGFKPVSNFRPTRNPLLCIHDHLNQMPQRPQMVLKQIPCNNYSDH